MTTKKTIINITLSFDNKESPYQIIIKKRIGEESCCGVIRPITIIKNKKILYKSINTVAKIIGTDRTSISREIKINKRFGESGIAPKVYAYKILQRDVKEDKKVINEYIDAVNKFEKDEKKAKKFAQTTKKFKYICIIIMQRLDGITLGKFLANDKNRLSNTQLDIICKKIEMIHKMNYIHNDLHLNNIFIDKKEPYIIDYGLSQYINPTKRDKNMKNKNYMNFLSQSEKSIFKGRHLKSVFKTCPKTDSDCLWSKLLKVDVNKQYCLKAGWPCERFQGLQIYLKCRTLRLHRKTNKTQYEKKYFDVLKELNKLEYKFNKFDILSLDDFNKIIKLRNKKYTLIKKLFSKEIIKSKDA